MSCEAFKLKLAIANLQKQHGLVSPPFTPLPLRSAPEHDIVLEGYASPATVDREFTMFTANCWTPFKQDIPILYRHDTSQRVGKLEDLRVDNNGLWARVRISHSEAKRAPYFSIAAILHSWRVVQNGNRPHVEIVSASLDEISLVPDDPGNADALAQRPPPAVEIYDFAQFAIEKSLRIIEVLQQNFTHEAAPQAPPPVVQPARGMMMICDRPAAAHIYGPTPPRPPKLRSEFGQLADALSQREV